MSDREEIERLYHRMYSAMVRKDRAELERIHEDSFILVHMTGMRQNKKSYIDSIMIGMLNYYEEETESVNIRVIGDDAVMTGRSRVTAAVFGGGRRVWRLELKFELKRVSSEWKFTRAEAYEY